MSMPVVAERRTGAALMLLRVVVGALFMVHGAQKVFFMGPVKVSGMFGMMAIPLPPVTSVVVMVVELLGGLALVLGLFTRPAALLLAVDMLGAIVFVHLKHGFFAPMGVEFPLTLLAAALALALAGPGVAALDNELARRRRLRL